MGADFTLEVFDWNQIEQAKSLGDGTIELAELEPFESIERSIKLSHEKHGEQGEIRLRLMFTPEIIARTRKNTSTFTSAGRAMTQIGALPFGAGKGVIHGVGKVGNKVEGVFRKDHAKVEPQENGRLAVDVAAGQASAPLGTLNSSNGTMFPSMSIMSGGSTAQIPNEAGTLRVSVLQAKDLSTPDGDAPKPYVVVSVDGKEQKTKHVNKSLSPEWNEALAFSAGPSTSKMTVKVLDRKTLGKDKTLGEADIDVCSNIFFHAM